MGPLCFNIYVNDMTQKISNQEQISYNFRRYQPSTSLVSIKWQLKFNISKCYVLHLGPSHSYGDYYMDGNYVITACNTVRDLGVSYCGQLFKVS